MDHFPMQTAIAALVFAIPVGAITGGIVAGILKARGRQRLLEIVHRERIAAIERGVDPGSLPPIPGLDAEMAKMTMLVRTFRQTNAQKAQGYLVTGLVMLSVGVGLSLMLALFADSEANQAWPAGLLPFSIGVGLILSSIIVRRSADADRNGGPNE